MSKTVPVISGDVMFWAYDVALGVLFVEAARVCAEMSADLRPPWRGELERDLRTGVVGGSGFAVLLDDYGAEQKQELVACALEAARRIEARGGVARDEVSTWPELEENATSFLRGAQHVDAAPLVELAEALADLAAGTLPPAPTGRYWYFGTPKGRTLQGG
ncbi:hypothetical protein [Streptomyces sp. NPDC059247]|uniref:hypothetical protein n=1 Tax=Streptomyces sp. NPDC059247 TaxID=3346790 RepID=UPI0036969341